jgi:MFS family permease
MPFLTASLLFIGFSDTLGGWLHGWMFTGSTVKQTTVVIFLLAVFAGMFDLFNMFVGSVYWYLFNDVVPEHLLSRFFGWFRMVGYASGALYNYFIFQYALSHMQLIYTCAAALYFIGFGVACLKVKEGQYPPPPDDGLRPSLRRDIRNFAAECFTQRFYWLIFLNTMSAAVSGTIGVFSVFYSQSMGLDLNLIGKSSAISGVAIVVCLSFAGVLADRWNAVRVDAYYNALLFCLLFTNLIWVFIDPPSTLVYFWVSIGGIPFTVLLSAISATAYMPRLMQLFPKDRFGGFCGAQALVRSAGTMVGGLVAGLYLDVVKRFYPEDSLQPYRYITVWQFFWGLVTFYFCYQVYRYWKRLGGEHGFTAPLTPVKFADLPKAQDSSLLKGMLIPLTISWCGTLLTFGFYCYYFLAMEPNPSSAVACSIVVGLVLLSLPALFGLLKFMERP